MMMMMTLWMWMMVMAMMMTMMMMRASVTARGSMRDKHFGPTLDELGLDSTGSWQWGSDAAGSDINKL